MAEPGVGSVVAGFRLDERIGMGGMGVVYAATDLGLGRRVAVKVLSGRLAGDPAQLARFDREARALSLLDSPHVVRILDHGVADGAPYIVTQFVDGGDLGSLLAERGPVAIATAAAMCAQVADALAAAHALGVVHRDVKPANVLVADPDAARPHLYLADFGVAHTADVRLTVAGAVVGSTDYLAPELADGSLPSEASDIYALGCLLWACLTGRPPYAGSEVAVAMAHRSAPVPQLAGTGRQVRSVNALLRQMLAKHPRDRVPRASSLAASLRSVPTSADQRTAPGRWRKPLLVVCAVVALAVAVTGGLLGGRALFAEDATPTGGGRQADQQSSGTAPGPVDTVNPEAQVTVTIGKGGQREDLVWEAADSGLVGPTASPSGVPAGAAPLQGDVDADGTPDRVEVALVPVGTDRSRPAVTVHLGATAETSGGGDVPTRLVRVALADVDGDGDRDLLLVDTGSDRRIWLLEASAGKFGAPVPWLDDTGTQPVRDLAVGDLDGDGDQDVVLHTRPPASGGAGRIEVVRSDGRGGARLVGGPRPLAGDPLDEVIVRAADLSGKGTDAIVVYRRPFQSRSVQVDVHELTDDGPGPARTALAFTSSAIILIKDWHTQLLATDVDGDGRDDLVRISGPDPDNGWLLDVMRAEGGGFVAPPSAAIWDCGARCSLADAAVWTDTGVVSAG